MKDKLPIRCYCLYGTLNEIFHQGGYDLLNNSCCVRSQTAY